MTAKRERLDALRSAAQERLRQRARAREDVPPDLGDALRLVHELEVHRIELELQSEELVAARDEAEASLRLAESLYDDAPVAYFTLDPTGKVRRVNRAGADLLGAAPQAIVGRPFGALFSADATAAVRATLARARGARGERGERGEREASGAGIPCEVELARRDAEPHARVVQLVVAGAVEHDEQRVVLVDVTEQRRTERRLRDAEKMAALGRLAAGVAHDFNNLLAVIALQVELAVHRDAGEARTALAEAKDAAARAKELTRQLLALGRGQASRPDRVDVHALATAAVRMLKPLLDDRITVDWSLASGPAHVWIDPSRLDQLIVNLLLNARDAMPAGGRITLGTEIVEGAEGPASRAVRFTVEDEGEGMSPSTVARAFEPFFSTKRDAGGTGLGLATVWSVAQEAGGSVAVESEPGRGTRMTVLLPLAGEAQASAALAASSSRERLQGTVLVVDDVAAIVEVCARALGQLGFHVLRARSGEEALAVASAHEGPIRVLLTDVCMPGMTGGMLAAAFAEVRPDTRVVLMSGDPSDDAGRRGASTTVLAKPFRVDELETALREVLDAKG